MDRSSTGVQCFRWWIYHVFVPGCKRLRRSGKNDPSGLPKQKLMGTILTRMKKWALWIISCTICSNKLMCFWKKNKWPKRLERMLIVPTWKCFWTMVLGQNSQLTVAMFYKDTARKIDVADPTGIAANANMGLKRRYAFSQESAIIEMAEPLFCDVFRSKRLLLSFVDLKIILNWKSTSFFYGFRGQCGLQSEIYWGLSQDT